MPAEFVDSWIWRDVSYEVTLDRVRGAELVQRTGKRSFKSIELESNEEYVEPGVKTEQAAAPSENKVVCSGATTGHPMYSPSPATHTCCVKSSPTPCLSDMRATDKLAAVNPVPFGGESKDSSS